MRCDRSARPRAGSRQPRRSRRSGPVGPPTGSRSHFLDWTTPERSPEPDAPPPHAERTKDQSELEDHDGIAQPLILVGERDRTRAVKGVAVGPAERAAVGQRRTARRRLPRAVVGLAPEDRARGSSHPVAYRSGCGRPDGRPFRVRSTTRQPRRRAVRRLPGSTPGSRTGPILVDLPAGRDRAGRPAR